MTEHIDRTEGRHLFGANPAAYETARPDYPDAWYDFLVAHRALGADTATLEIGAGSGLATRALLRHGADPLTLLEPDVRFLPALRAVVGATRAHCTFVHAPFEQYDARAPFTLIAAATAFHWVEPDAGYARLARLCAPGGHVALWWNVLADLDRRDLFHEATHHLLRDLAVSPSGASDAIPHALDRVARAADFARTGAFEPVRYFEARWTHTLLTPGIRMLYGSFSQVQRLDSARRDALLDALTDVAEREFGGRVERYVTCAGYLARRR